MYLSFIDSDGSRGTVSADWVVEYDGRFAKPIETAVSNAKYDGNATGNELQDLSMDLFREIPLSEIRFVENHNASTNGTESHRASKTR
jgi:hypothetical protein